MTQCLHHDHDDGRSGPAVNPEAISPAPLTAEEQRTANFLATGLGQLRMARPGFQDHLEARLLARLADAGEHALPPSPAATAGRRLRSWRLPRRSLLGVAAAVALALLASSLTLPLVGPPEASAREILEKAQANVDNPVLAGVRSYHLTAKILNNRLREGGPASPTESVTEQWFVSPDKMRTETRATDRSGKAVVSGLMLNGAEAKHYSTDGATDVTMIGVFAVPAVPASLTPDGPTGAAPAGPVASPATSTTAYTAGRSAPAAGEKAHTVAAVTVTRRIESKPAAEQPDGGAAPGVRVAVHERTEEDGETARADIVVIGADCPEPTRTGTGTVAGRAVFVIESDLSACLPADAPGDLRGKHVRWVDQQTYLPLKMEAYGHDGRLMNRYEVTSIEYDIGIPAEVFSQLPAGTSLREPKPLPAVRP